MSQPHPEEESWQSKRIRESAEKKLFVLHTENGRLKAQQEEYQSAIEEYIRKIDLFTQKSLLFEEENGALKTQVKALQGRTEQVEAMLLKRNEEYCSLYNYLFTERRIALQDTLLKEMDLNNRLNEIQHDSDAQIIERLKANIRNKNQELLRSAKRIEELNATVLTSSFEYQEQIHALKEDNMRLQKTAISNSLTPSNSSGDIGEYFSRKKIEGLQREILLYRQELQEIKAKLAEAKSISTSLETKNEQLATELEAIRNRTPSYDLSIFNTLTNIKNLEERLSYEQEKNRILIEKSAELSVRKHEIDDIVESAADLKRKQAEISQLRNENTLHSAENVLKSSEIKKHEDRNRQLQLQLSSLRIVSASAIDKLKRLVQFYCPYYFKREKLELYNLSKEQQEFIREENVEKTLVTVKKQIDQKIKENSQLKTKHAEVERTANLQKEKIIILEQELSRRNAEIKTMSETVSSLMERKGQAMGEIIQNEEQGRNWGYEEIDLDENEEEGIPEETSARVKVQILEKALEEMQADRTELVDIIRGRDAKLIELTAEVNALRNIPTTSIKLHSFPNIPPYHPIAQPDSTEEDKLSTQTVVQQVREQLRRLSEDFKQDRQLLVKYYERREAENISKYSTLLRNFDDLSIKYNALQSSTAPRQEIPANNEEMNQQLPNEPQVEPSHQSPEIAHHQSDQSAISESAIENFTDILKKYEREFNKYVAIYETQIKKTLESVEGVSQEGEGMMEGEHVQRLQALIEQHCETTKNLESLLEEKQKSSSIQIKQLEGALEQSRKTASELSQRLSSADSTISQLRSQVLSQKTKLDFGSEESSNSAFTLLNLKNKEIDSLKNALSALKRSHQEREKELARLRDLPSGQSQYEAQELRVLRQLMGEQDLLGVLESVLQRLRD